MRADDSRRIARFKCLCCSKTFSHATQTLECRQKKRRVNFQLYKLIASGISMRRAALILNIHRTTVDRKLIYLAQKARQEQEQFLQQLQLCKISRVQFDDLITIEHTKMKPLTVSLAIDKNTRKILHVEVAQIPAFGHLAQLSRKKYGYRQSMHKQSLERMFKKLTRVVDQRASFESDEHKLYPPMMGEYFPRAEHIRYKGGRSCIAGQGELKKLNYDPLFQLNHTCAMLRANINRLFRKTWCTTKNPARLADHIAIYMQFHNQILTK